MGVVKNTHTNHEGVKDREYCTRTHQDLGQLRDFEKQGK